MKPDQADEITPDALAPLLLNSALHYAGECGLSVIPVARGAKRPHVRWREYQSRIAADSEIRGWWSRWPTASIGVVTGSISGGLVVLDADDAAAAKYVEVTCRYAGVVPITVSTGRAGGGRHYWFRAQDGIRNAAGIGGFALDVRGEGGYVVAPPSAHASGLLYRLVDGSPDWPPAPLPDALAQLAPEPLRETSGQSSGRSLGGLAPTAPRSPRERLFDPYLAARGRVRRGQRHDALVRLTGRLCTAGVHLPTIVAEVRAANARNCDPPLPGLEVQAILSSARGWTRRSRWPVIAVIALLRARVGICGYDRERSALRIRMLATGGEKEWSLASAQALQLDAVDDLGDLRGLAIEACPSGGRAEDVVRALRWLARDAGVDEARGGDPTDLELLYGIRRRIPKGA